MLKRNIFATVFLVLGVLAFAGSALYGTVIRHKADAILAELENEKDMALVEDDDPDVNAEPLNPEDFLKAAQDAGSALCEIQKTYAKSIQSMDGLEGDALDEVLVEQKTFMADMKGYFKENVSMPPIWYEGNNYDMTASWVFTENYKFDKSSVDCLWLCKDEGGQIVAYATGKFDGRAGLFSGIDIQTTGYGNSKMGVTLQNERTEDEIYNNGVSSDYVDSILDMAGQNDVEATKSLTPEQEQDKADAYSQREALYEEWLKENGGGN